jgi:hypothetical protein
MPHADRVSIEGQCTLYQVAPGVNIICPMYIHHEHLNSNCEFVCVLLSPRGRRRRSRGIVHVGTFLVGRFIIFSYVSWDLLGCPFVLCDQRALCTLCNIAGYTVTSIPHAARSLASVVNVVPFVLVDLVGLASKTVLLVADVSSDLVRLSILSCSSARPIWSSPSISSNLVYKAFCHLLLFIVLGTHALL